MSGPILLTMDAEMYRCPECGRPYPERQPLLIHRALAHGQ